MEKETTKTKLQALCKVLAEEGMDPLRQLVGWVLSGEPAYLAVHKGGNRELKREVAKMDRDELLTIVFSMALQ